jgi:hypothetical protein
VFYYETVFVPEKEMERSDRYGRNLKFQVLIYIQQKQRKWRNQADIQPTQYSHTSNLLVRYKVIQKSRLAE